MTRARPRCGPLTLADITAEEREHLEACIHEAGHAVATVALSGVIRTAVVSQSKVTGTEGLTSFADLPPGRRPEILYAGPWAQARWNANRRPTQRELFAVLGGGGRGDCQELSLAELAAALPGDVHSCLAALRRSGRVTRPRRGVYAPAAEPVTAAANRGLSPQTVRSTLTTFGAVVQSYTDQGVLPRNVVALVDRPKDADAAEDMTATETAAKSWTLAEAERFRAAVADHRLFACWLLSCYGLRRSEVLGLRWDAINLDTGVLAVRRGRVAVGGDVAEGDPKSRRSRRELPLPADVTEALRSLKTRQRAEALALGVGWSDDRLVAVHEDGTPLRPESYTDEFQRLRARTGLRRIKLHGLRNTSVSLMLDQGHPPHIVAAWHGHDPAVALSIYADVKADELRAVGASLFR